jgi:hypothetical protein
MKTAHFFGCGLGGAGLGGSGRGGSGLSNGGQMSLALSRDSRFGISQLGQARVLVQCGSAISPSLVVVGKREFQRQALLPTRALFEHH